MINYPTSTVVEGATKIIVPDVEAFRKSPSSFPPSDAPVFYNKKMEINRDFALATLRIFLAQNEKDSYLFCEPMAGSGIRSVRVANELSNVDVIINDLNPFAVELITENILKLNLENKTKVLNLDANQLMLQYAAEGKRFDMLDLDPFGSPAPFIDSAAQAMSKNSLLAVTSTDMATMCGVYPSACIRKYSSQPIHSWIAHELAIRMQISFTTLALARHGKNSTPVFSHSTEHFIRTYHIVEKGITKAKNTLNTIGHVAHCQNCYALESVKGIVNSLSDKCPNCGKKRAIGGPVWLGKLYNESFVLELTKEIEKDDSIYGTKKRMLKMLSLIREEVLAEKESEDTQFYYDLHQIADKLNLSSPKMSGILDLLRERGFAAYRTHFRTNSIKTNARINDIITILEKVSKEHQ